MASADGASRRWAKPKLNVAGVIAWLLGYLLGGLTTAIWFLVITSLIATIIGFIVEKRISAVPLVLGLVGAVLGLLSDHYRSARVFELEASVIQLAIAIACLVSPFLRASPLKSLAPKRVVLSARAWERITIFLGIMALVVAVTNALLWRLASRGTWVLSHSPGTEIVYGLFFLLQLPWLLKDSRETKLTHCNERLS